MGRSCKAGYGDNPSRQHARNDDELMEDASGRVGDGDIRTRARGRRGSAARPGSRENNCRGDGGSPREWRGHGRGLKADLMDSADKVIASVTAPSGSGDAQTVQLAVPSSAPPGSARIKIYKTSAPATAFATHAVTLIKAENMDVSALIIETDKPVYKPGQTVQVRVLSLTSKGSSPGPPR